MRALCNCSPDYVTIRSGNFTFSTMSVSTATAMRPFLGAEIQVAYEAARVVILPIPYEVTTTYRRGCENGPAAILEASDQLEYYDEELGAIR